MGFKDMKTWLLAAVRGARENRLTEEWKQSKPSEATFFLNQVN